MRFGVKIPDLIINGINSEYLISELAPNRFQNISNNIRWDLYTNGYGFYWVYAENGTTYVRPKDVTIAGLPDCWALKDDSTMTIIDHEVSKFIGIDPLRKYDVYENSYGTFYLYTDETGCRIVEEKDAWHPLSFHGEDYIWHLDEDYMRYSPHRYKYVDGGGFLPDIF